MKASNLRILYGLVLACAALAAVACQSRATETASAKQFLEQVYSQYKTDGKGPDTLRADAPQLFAPDLLALIREDQRVAAGEVGLLDHDPICACQDFEALSVKEINVAAAGKNQATAQVIFSNGGQTVHVRFSLISLSGQWRIQDIEEPGIPSLSRYLADGLKKQ